jgi:hypothetical protein
LCRLKTCTHSGQTCTHFGKTFTQFGEPWPQAHFFRGSGPVISKFSVIEPAVTVIFSCDASDGSDPVAILLGGGSLAPLGALDPAVARTVVGMVPVAEGDVGELRDPRTRQGLVSDGPAGVALRSGD